MNPLRAHPPDSRPTGSTGSDRPAAQAPACSIILPFYNRAAFLPQALAAIAAQRFTDWELIGVDDGSTDAGRQIFENLTADWPQPVRCVSRPNGGAYAARNTGLDLARGRFIAFYDSDDLWLDHHLLHCITALQNHPDIDWVYAACRIVAWPSGRLLLPCTFYDPAGRPRPFMTARTRRAGNLHIIDDPRAPAIAIRYGFYNGLQNSVIRATVFHRRRFDTAFHNEAEDQLFAARALLAGHRLARLDDVHVVYRVHEHNASAAATGASLDRQLAVNAAVARGFEQLLDQVDDPALRRAVRRRLLDEYVWKQGYALLWMSGRRRQALECFRRGLQRWPWDWRAWKTYLAASCRYAAAA